MSLLPYGNVSRCRSEIVFVTVIGIQESRVVLSHGVGNHVFVLKFSLMGYMIRTLMHYCYKWVMLHV
jgi:hypothetical protein